MYLLALCKGFTRLNAGVHSNVVWQLIGPSNVTCLSVLTPFLFNGAQYVMSSHVMAMAIGPTCKSGTCPIYIGAAGGSLCKAKDALSGSPCWEFISRSFGMSTIGSLLMDSEDASGFWKQATPSRLSSQVPAQSTVHWGSGWWSLEGKGCTFWKPTLGVSEQAPSAHCSWIQRTPRATRFQNQGAHWIIAETRQTDTCRISYICHSPWKNCTSVLPREPVVDLCEEGLHKSSIKTRQLFPFSLVSFCLSFFLQFSYRTNHEEQHPAFNLSLTKGRLSRGCSGDPTALLSSPQGNCDLFPSLSGFCRRARSISW